MPFRGAAPRSPRISADARPPLSPKRTLWDGGADFLNGANGEEMSNDNPDRPLTNADGSLEFEPATTMAGYDNYRSLQNSNLLIFVPHDAVPPFRFKAGGWELLQSSIELGSAMKARIAENGFFMFRVNEGKDAGSNFLILKSRL
jgi:hypothetical protein